MDQFKFFMPAETFFGRGCILENKESFLTLGTKAMLITGRSSAKKNGAQKDVTDALDACKIPWVLFDEIGENPDVETVVKAAKMAHQEKVDFLIGIGGGSPMDAAKAIAVLAANPQADSEILFTQPDAKALTVAEIPTTAGTGSEVTQYSIMTLHEKRTKRAIIQKVFAKASFLDPKYMDELSAEITNNTAVDALTHLIESYLSVNANFFSEKIVELGLSLFKDCIPALKERVYTSEVRDKLMLASALAGVAIAQTSTSIPHCLGYFLTYEKGIPHGRANGIVTQAYLEMFPKVDKKVGQLLHCLDMNSIEDMGAFLKDVLHTSETFTVEEVAYYTERAMESPQKIATFPYPAVKEDIFKVYEKSLLS
ncbi:iron-containing alcohol dehydrogenase family protein [Anaerotignum propionicum]|uniref:Alcohol dehydrogenase n=1 Tax=Anaerotignum propionicum DSM 1682 TaxID=991789 RepID=A0A110A773_ANAPI|nr:iron-containing alcohol dehydrogenase family protein [Anaerotignum propionicum]AMJ41658.1 long-chain primary alcohol dehydrogenase AdhA [Anaerotignum propionicum DSM 1682]SHE88467.1 alcohol dehydrogenase [[Clostridium] propionicum DSM 1682] [Anaerotignum propionicum DSM 1682]